MYKALALTALAGVASAKMWEKEILPVTTLSINDGNFNILQMGLQITFDTGYQTQYNPKLGDAYSMA